MGIYLAVALSILLYGYTTWALMKCLEKKLDENYKRCYLLFWTNPWDSTHQNSSCTATYLPSYKPFKSDEQDMLGSTGEVSTNS